ncbi:aminopeptidase P family protein [Nakamurella leprariae]|uniref:Aminopeptidase P family protein n=1 Tax=Nakamurella leprariae TaxID=2803911 RepID=A0A938YCR8_9ACTN|nr:aminopeptidase P family protein [Nakamurella leprariae]MBM9468257.1 aminopeptidase P family protein [Nakamurella leprariae]
MPAFPYAARRAAVAATLADRGLEGLLVTDLINVRYLTGFTGSNAALMLLAEDPASIDPDAPVGERLTGSTFCTDGRYVTQSAAQVPDLPRLIDRPSDRALLRRAQLRRVGFEADAVSVAAHDALQQVASRSTEAGPDRAVAVELVATTRVVEGFRAVKDEAEIETLRRACAVADQAFAGLLDSGVVRPGVTERTIGLDLDQRMRTLGAEDPSFETIVAAGANSAIPHHRPTAAVLAAGDFVKFDFGATVDGYHSDMTRTIVLGRPADWQREVFDLVLAAQQAGRDAVAPGRSGGAIDAASRAVIADAGYGDRFLHGLGHGVGLQVHEAPSLAASATGTMVAGMCVTVEPGVYLEGRGGVRIEDSGVVRPGGFEVLTSTGRGLRQV